MERKKKIFFALLILAVIVVPLAVWEQTRDTKRPELEELKAEEGAKTMIVRTKTIESYKEEQITEEFSWVYKNQTYTLNLGLYPEIYRSFKAKDRVRDYDLFASDPYSEEIMRTITNALKDYGLENNLSISEIPFFLISFAQYLPYTSDITTTGFDEYRRFPYETIYDHGGDCEDTSILVSAMLKELDFNVALLKLPDHVAVGIKCSPEPGQTFYSLENTNYCYLETTGKGWNVGKVPPNIETSTAEVKPIVARPALYLDFTLISEYDEKNVLVDVDVKVSNFGSNNAEGAKIYVALQADEEGSVWDEHQGILKFLRPEETYIYKVKDLQAFTGKSFRVQAKVWGDNIKVEEAYSEWITLVYR